MEFIEILKALLTPIIAILAVYLAYQQYRINKRNSKYQIEIDLKRINLELYNKRYKIFTETKNIILKLSKYAEIDSQSLSDFVFNTNEHKFLFGPEIVEYLDELFKNATTLTAKKREQSNTDIYPVPSLQRKKIIAEYGELLNWFTNEYENCEAMFIKYLDFRNL